MVTLYTATGACGLHVQIVAREAGVKFDLALVDLAAKQTADGRDLGAVTSKGYIPALQLEDGTALTEGAAITQWLADQAPSSGLLPPSGDLDRYRVIEWQIYIATEIHAMFRPFFGPATDRERGEAAARIIERLGLVELQLGQTAHLAGERFTIADAYAFNVIGWITHANIDIGRFPKTQAYLAAIARRPCVRESMIAEGLAVNAVAA